ncbi:elongation factor P hydroxylase [Pectobacteriaceae bacterium CE90]|nr:elongation factor P hydroxylase [Pectobacteriaceae bacterium CE90]
MTTSPQHTVVHRYDQLIQLFNDCFSRDYNTQLIKGEDEPIYLPADEQVPYHRIVFAHGFYASAMHEISHWCIAGAARRLQVDFGYWYCPDGRDAETQHQFEDVEIKPQALEWLFCVAAGFPFNVSCDNLNGEVTPDRIAFQRRVHGQVMRYLQHTIPERPARFINALQLFYNTAPLTSTDFPYPDDLC